MTIGRRLLREGAGRWLLLSFACIIGLTIDIFWSDPADFTYFGPLLLGSVVSSCLSLYLTRRAKETDA